MFKHAKKGTEPHVLMFYASPHGITPAVVTRELQPQNASIHDKKLARVFLPRINNGDIEDYTATAVSFTVWQSKPLQFNVHNTLSLTLFLRIPGLHFPNGVRQRS